MANPLNPNDGYGDYSDEQLAQLPGAPKRAATGGYTYGWRPQAYQDILGENDVAQQTQLTTFRAQGGKVAEDDAGAAKQLSGEAPVQYQTPAQQWNAQPAPQQGQPGGDLFKLLMDRIQQPATPDANDPTIRRQADAFNANTERSMRNYLADVAEKQGPYGSIGNETRLANERAGQAGGAFEAELFARAEADRRDEIMQSLQLYGSLMNADQRMGLERELANLDFQSQAQGRTLQNDQFLRELALRETGQNNSMDLAWASLF
jgi:hypothetical protein